MQQFDTATGRLYRPDHDRKQSNDVADSGLYKKEPVARDYLPTEDAFVVDDWVGSAGGRCAASGLSHRGGERLQVDFFCMIAVEFCTWNYLGFMTQIHLPADPTDGPPKTVCFAHSARLRAIENADRSSCVSSNPRQMSLSREKGGAEHAQSLTLTRASCPVLRGPPIQAVVVTEATVPAPFLLPDPYSTYMPPALDPWHFIVLGHHEACRCNLTRATVPLFGWAWL
uniref:Uncharacterized protein n=1 Tax=Panagrellus redivivus TaxID=6233 RepID=A0A7E4VYL7_PANRE